MEAAPIGIVRKSLNLTSWAAPMVSKQKPSPVRTVRRRPAEAHDFASSLCELARSHILYFTNPRGQAEDLQHAVQSDIGLDRLPEALDSLASMDPRLAECVDLKFFCGFSFVDIAQLWGVSRAHRAA